jgi:hypothetical protein
MKNALIVILLLIVLFLGSVLNSTQSQMRGVQAEYETVFTRMVELSREQGAVMDQDAKLRNACGVGNAIAGMLGVR